MWSEFLRKCGIETIPLDISSVEETPLDENNFLLKTQQIKHLLQEAEQTKSDINLIFKGEQVSRTSHVVQIDNGNSTFLILRPFISIDTQDRTNHAFNLILPYRNTSIVLSSKVESELEWNKIPCYAINMPISILSTEMRQFSRVNLPQNHGAKVLLTLNQIDFFRAPIQDICENGFRIKITQDNHFAPKKQNDIFLATIELPNHPSINVNVRVRDFINKQNTLEIGFEIIGGSEKTAQLLRRFILKSAASKVHTRY